MCGDQKKVVKPAAVKCWSLVKDSTRPRIDDAADGFHGRARRGAGGPAAVCIPGRPGIGIAAPGAVGGSASIRTSSDLVESDPRPEAGAALDALGCVGS